MLSTIAAVLTALWLVGLMTSYTMGGVVHVLLVIAVIMVLVNVIQADDRYKQRLTEAKKLETP